MQRTINTLTTALKLAQRAVSGWGGAFVALWLIVGFAPLATMAQDDGTITVHAPGSKAAFTEISNTSGYEIVARNDRWQTVRFKQPTVPVWVSSDFLFRENGRATVIANRLNMRTGPSMQSEVLASVARGYQSTVLRERSGFSQILAPGWVTFALTNATRSAVTPRTGNSDVATQSAANNTEWRTHVPPGQLDGDEKKPLDSSSENVSRVQTPVPSGASGDNSELASASTNPSAELSVEAQQHRLAPGDIISLSVFGESELSVSNLRIPQSGDVSFPLIGPYQVAGKTTNEVESQLRQVLAQGYVRNPRLSVSIDSYRPIFVLGAAQRIGSFPYSEGLTVAKAIAVAGGAKFSAKADGVSVLRDGELVHDGLSMDSSIRVLSGDIISIDEEAGVSSEATAYVYLHGEVRSPGEYEFRRGLTVEKAVVLAGGFTLRASRKRISVSRINEGEDEPSKMKRVKLHMPIKPGDIIDVGASWL